MARAIREYQIRPMVCDWALDIPMGNTTFVLHFNSRNNAELVKAILEWEDSHPNEAIPYQPTLTPPNEALTLGLVDKYGAPLYAGDTVAADKFFMYAIRYGSHNVNPKQCEPAYQVGWYLEIVWALYNEDKTYIGHTEALYDIGGVAARYPAHCADTTEGVQNLLLYKHRPPEVSP